MPGYDLIPNQPKFSDFSGKEELLIFAGTQGTPHYRSMSGMFKSGCTDGPEPRFAVGRNADLFR